MATDFEKLRADPHRYRRLQAAAVSKLFKQEHGREPETLQEIEEWLPTGRATEVDPFQVLSAEEIDAVVREEG